jgi:hypothetical protein
MCHAVGTTLAEGRRQKRDRVEARGGAFSSVGGPDVRRAPADFGLERRLHEAGPDSPPTTAPSRPAPRDGD